MIEINEDIILDYIKCNYVKFKDHLPISKIIHLSFVDNDNWIYVSYKDKDNIIRLLFVDIHEYNIHLRKYKIKRFYGIK